MNVTVEFEEVSGFGGGHELQTAWEAPAEADDLMHYIPRYNKNGGAFTAVQALGLPPSTVSPDSVDGLTFEIALTDSMPGDVYIVQIEAVYSDGSMVTAESAPCRILIGTTQSRRTPPGLTAVLTNNSPGTTRRDRMS